MDLSSPSRGKTPVPIDPNVTPKNIRWNYEMQHQFLEFLHNEDKLGNRIGSTFTGHAYRNILDELQSTYGVGLQKRHLINKIRLLKHNYNEFKDALRGMSGFAWNWETKKFEAESHVREALIKDNPSAVSIRGKSCLHWDIMDTLWSSNRAVGNMASTARRYDCAPRRRLETLSEDSSSPANNNVNPHGYREASTSAYGGNESTDQQMPNIPGSSRPSTGSGSTKLKRKAASEYMPRSVQCNLSADVSRALVDSAEIIENRHAPRPCVPSEIIFKAMEELDLCDDYLIECHKFLSVNHEDANMFIGTSRRLRRVMLEQIMKK